MIEEGLLLVKESFGLYMGNTGAAVLFFAALLFLIITEKDRQIKMLTVYTVIICIAVLNPIIAFVSQRVFIAGVYWRIFWLLPMNIILAYTIVRLWNYADERRKRACMNLLLALLVVVSGKLIYTPDNFKAADNQYKIPREVIEVCDIINMQGEEAKVAATKELIPYIRQYDAGIKLLYGRNYTKENMTRYKKYNVYREVNSDAPDYEDIVRRCRNNKCNFIVFRKTAAELQRMQDYDFELVGETEKYSIYKDSTT